MSASQTQADQLQTVENDSTKRIMVVDLVRAISILSVMAHHFGARPPEPGESALYSAALNFLNTFGNNSIMGVSIFFIVSGFLIARINDLRYGSLFQVDIRDFYIRRIARIWPLMFLVLSIALYFVYFVNTHQIATPKPIDAILSTNPANFDSWFFLSIFTFTTNILVQARPNVYGIQWTLLWSLSVEEQFYLFFPLVCRLVRNEKLFLWVVAALIVLGPIQRYTSVTIGPVPTALLSSFGAFDLLAMGMLLFIMNKKTAAYFARHPWHATSLNLAGFIIATIAWVGTNRAIPIQYALGQSVLGLGAFMFLLGGLSMRVYKRIPALLLAPGFLSYGMYLYHALLLLFVVGMTHTDRLSAYGQYVAATMGIAGLCYFLYERPFNKVIIRRFARKRPES